jgi:hypothetical protein
MIDDQKYDFRMKAGAYQEGKHIVSVFWLDYHLSIINNHKGRKNDVKSAVKLEISSTDNLFLTGMILVRK